MNFLNFLKTCASQVDSELSNYFKKWRIEASNVSNNLLPLIDEAIKACEGGKRLRGALVVFGYEFAGGKNLTEILKPAAAFEIFQTAILAHDDVIDKSPLRRNKPTIYYALGANHYGLSQTICLGDIGFFQAYQIISESNFSAEIKNKALNSFSKTMLETALGQMLDVEGKEDPLIITRFKTARYTLVGPLQLGAILAGADQKLLDLLKDFGDNLGVAFQIQDDILGVFGTEKQTGKSITSDIEEGKNTLLITQALEKASKKQKEVLKKYYGKQGLAQDKFGEVKKIFIETGSLDYSRQVAVKYVNAAKKLIPELTRDQKHRGLLFEMADFLVERNR